MARPKTYSHEFGLVLYTNWEFAFGYFAYLDKICVSKIIAAIYILQQLQPSCSQRCFLFIHLVFIQVERVRMDQADSPPFTAQFLCGVRKSKNSNPRYVSTEVLRSHHADKQPKILIVIIPGLHASACSRIHMSVGLDCLESATTVASS